MAWGFEFCETMSGNCHFANDAGRERAMSFTVGVRARDLVRFARDNTAELRGEVDLEGFADHRPVRGSIYINPIFGRAIRYSFTFEANDGRTYAFEGQKDVDFRRVLSTMTTLPGVIRDAAGERVGEARLRFDVRSDLAAFLRSFRALTV